MDAGRGGRAVGVRTLRFSVGALVAEGLERCPSGTNKPVFLGDALGCNLHHLLAAYVGQVGQFRHAGNQLVDAQLGGLVGGTVGGTGASAGNGAAGGEDNHVGQLLLGFGFFGRGGGGQDQQQGEGAGGEGFEYSIHRYCSLSS